MPTTPFKGYEVQTTGSNSGTWGSVLNASMISIVDNNLGGVVAKSLASSDVTLTGSELQCLILRLTGAIPTNRVVTAAIQGIMIVENLTSGNFTVTFTDGVGSTVIPQGARSLMICDTTNGSRIAAGTFSSGTAMLFAQSAAPVGWTKSTSQDNAALRLVSGTGGGTGGSVDFTTAFASQTPSGGISNTALSVNQIPAHRHFVANQDTNSANANLSSSNTMAMVGGYGSSSSNYQLTATATDAFVAMSSSTGSGDTHSHTFSGNAINFAVKYRDVILCTKD